MVRQSAEQQPGAAQPAAAVAASVVAPQHAAALPPAAALAAPAAAPPLHHHELYCAPYGEYYPPDYFMPPPDMCPPQICTLHGDYSGVGAMGSLGMPGVLQQMVDENGAVRHVIVAAHHLPPPPPPHHQHQPHQHHQHQQPQQHYGPANGGTGPAYYGPPGNFAPPHYHVGHPPPPAHHLTHSPPPPQPPSGPYLKDERTHRQYVKLKRKLEQKHTNRNNGLDVNSGSSTPSPRKELMNGSGGSGSTGDGRSHGGAASTSSEGEGSSATTSVQGDEDEATTALLDMLSSARPPQVSEITSYSALVQWNAPVPPGFVLPTGELTYELLLGDKGRYKAIYSGPSLSCRVRDLRPGTEYSVCLQVRAGELTGEASGAASFRAPAALPGVSSSLRASQRSRSSLQLRWQAAPDNGSRILHYVLECDSGDGVFKEIAKPRMRQHAANCLLPGARYRFRLAAVNECGRGPWSEEVSLWTNGLPPPSPAPPRLIRAGPHSLHLNWTTENRTSDQSLLHELQIEDERSRHGFIPVYEGPAADYLCDGLDRKISYKFRLRASNDDGQSRWSAEVSFATTSENPGIPGKPLVKGKIHSRFFRVRWDPPSDDGGAESLSYMAEIDGGDGFKPIYEGAEMEAICDKLQPGTTYRIRVRCLSEGGVSEWSDTQSVMTEPTFPEACDIPWLAGKPKSNSASIAWKNPSYDGGAPVHEYQLDLIDSIGERRTPYIGPETHCEITDLLPGKDYQVQVKATNKAGAGPFSPIFVFRSEAAPPDAPDIPETSVKSPFHIRVDWNEPDNNGALIIDYQLEVSTENVDHLYIPYFHGLQNGCDVKSLTPFKTYYFRVSASNSAGTSPWSSSCCCDTPVAAPATPMLPRAETTATTIDLRWQAPADHGAPILHYLIDLGDKVIPTANAVEEYLIENLTPETTYKIKLIAVNEIGASCPSSTLRISTRPPPPPPPRLECIYRAHNYVKLKWGDGKNADFTQYTVEMESLRVPDEFQCVYSGTAYTCKVKRLQENTAYRFRICAANDHGGEGDYSAVHVISTSGAPPPAMLAPRVTSVEVNAIEVEWSPPDNANESGGEPLLYTLQCSKAKDQIYKQVYNGIDCHVRLESLDGGCDYCLRVSAVRGVLQGAWSSVARITTAATPPAVIAAVPTASPRPRRARATAPLTDRHWAMLLLMGFMIVAILAAAAVEHFINWRRASDA